MTFRRELKDLMELLWWLRFIAKVILIPVDDPDLIFLLQENKELLGIVKICRDCKEKQTMNKSIFHFTYSFCNLT